MTAPRTFAVVGLGLAIARRGRHGSSSDSPSQAPFLPVAFGFGRQPWSVHRDAGLSWASIGALLVSVARRTPSAGSWSWPGSGYALSQLSVVLTFVFAADDTAAGRPPRPDRRLDHRPAATGRDLPVRDRLHLSDGPRPEPRDGHGSCALFWVLAIVFVVISLTQPGPLHLFPAVDNPFGIGPDLRGGRPIAPILRSSRR